MRTQWYRWGSLCGLVMLACALCILSSAETALVAHAADTPTAVKAGTFVNAVETGSGTATIYQLADNSYILRLENFRVDNGPDLRVQVVATDGTVLDLGGLKGNQGNQNYQLPTDFDPAAYDTARIFCRAVQIVMIMAPLN